MINLRRIHPRRPRDSYLEQKEVHPATIALFFPCLPHPVLNNCLWVAKEAKDIALKWYMSYLRGLETQ